MIRVVLIDDHAAFREALALVLSLEPDLAVVGQAGTISEARPLVARADVVLLDLALHGESGFDLLQEVKGVCPGASMLVLTASARRADVAQAVELGAAGLLYKSVYPDVIIDAVRRLARGERLFTRAETAEFLQLASRQRAETQAAEAALQHLTRREREVLQTLSEGLSDKLIARKLSVSTETIRSHMVRILGKLGVQSRLEAVVFAIRHGAVKVH